MYEQRTLNGTVITQIRSADRFGATYHVPVSFKDANGNFQYGWFPLDLWMLLPIHDSNL